MADEEKRRKGAGRPKSNKEWKKGNGDVYAKLFANDTPDNPFKHKGKLACRMVFNCVNNKLTEEYMKDDTGVYYMESEETPFSSLTAQQLANLLPILNDNCFVEAQTAKGLQEIFEGKRTAKVRNIGVLAYILRRLAERDLICGDWQHQAETNKMFVSVNGIVITAKKFSNYRGDFEAKVNKATLFPKDKRCTNVLPIYEEIEDFFASI